MRLYGQVRFQGS